MHNLTKSYNDPFLIIEAESFSEHAILFALNKPSKGQSFIFKWKFLFQQLVLGLKHKLTRFDVAEFIYCQQKRIR